MRSTDVDALGELVQRLFPGARLVACEPLGNDAGAAVSRKQGGYGEPLEVSVVERDGTQRTLVFRTASANEFGHDRRADRAADALLAFDTFNSIPAHVRALDVGAITPRGLVSLQDATELYLVTTYAEGQLYASDLRAIAREGVAAPRDVERCEALARWLVELHRERVVNPVAWRRAVRDLVGGGEGVFGVVDAYSPGVACAPPERLAALEQACVAWRARLRTRAGRLRRTHGDFHPFNIVFCEGTRFALLDASRGGLGDPADDVIALSVNYVFFALQAPRAWPRGLGRLWRRFWSTYLGGGGDRGVLETAAPYLAWRALVLGCPRFYPDLPASARDALLSFAERALAAPAFDPDAAETWFR